MRMLQYNTAEKSSIPLFSPEGMQLFYKRWYHVAIQFSADGIGKTYTTWINDQKREQGNLEDAGIGLAWLRLQPLSYNGDTYDFYMTNVSCILALIHRRKCHVLRQNRH